MDIRSLIIRKDEKALRLHLSKNDYAQEEKAYAAFNPLHLACALGEENIVKLLIAKGKANVHAQTRSGHTALHIAAFRQIPDVVSTLLEHESKVCVKDKRGNTPLHLAACNGNKAIVEMLWNSSSPSKEEKMRNECGNTPLHYAAASGNIDCVKFLLPHFEDDNGVTKPFHFAAQEGMVDVMELLVEKQSNPSVIINAESSIGFTPLHYAASQGRNEAVEWLIKKGVSGIDKRVRGYTALHLAARNGHSEVVRTLLFEGAANPWVENKKGQRAIDLAHVFNHGKQVVPLFLSRWRDSSQMKQIMVPDKDGVTVLHYVLAYGTEVDIKWAIDNIQQEANTRLKGFGTSILHEILNNLKDSRGQNPLNWGAAMGNLPALKLLEEGSLGLCDERVPDGNRLIFYALFHGHFDFAEQLIKYLNDDKSWKDDVAAWVMMEKKRMVVSSENDEFENILPRRMSPVLEMLWLSYVSRTRNAMSTVLEILWLSVSHQSNFLVNLFHSSGARSRRASSRARSRSMWFLTIEIMATLTIEIMAAMWSLTKWEKIARVIFIADLPPMYVALYKEKYDIAKFIHKYGVDELNKQGGIIGRTSLHWAALLGKTELASRLLGKEFGEGLVADATDKLGCTALAYARERCFEEIEELLMRRRDIQSHVQDLHESNQEYRDAANGLLVVAALIAGGAFNACLQPPFDDKFSDKKYHKRLKLFWSFDSFSFFFAVAALLVVSGAVLPSRRSRVNDTPRVVDLLLFGSFFLAISVTFAVAAFISAVPNLFLSTFGVGGMCVAFYILFTSGCLYWKRFSCQKRRPIIIILHAFLYAFQHIPFVSWDLQGSSFINLLSIKGSGQDSEQGQSSRQGSGQANGGEDTRKMGSVPRNTWKERMEAICSDSWRADCWSTTHETPMQLDEEGDYYDIDELEVILKEDKLIHLHGPEMIHVPLKLII